MQLVNATILFVVAVDAFFPVFSSFFSLSLSLSLSSFVSKVNRLDLSSRAGAEDHIWYRRGINREGTTSMDQCALRVLILGCFAVDSGGNFRVSSSVIMRNLFIFHLLLSFLCCLYYVVVVVRNSLRTTIFSRKGLIQQQHGPNRATLHGARV